jgi:hypothetical protein
MLQGIVYRVEEIAAETGTLPFVPTNARGKLLLRFVVYP